MKFRKLCWMIMVIGLAMVLAACAGNTANPNTNGSATSSNTLSQRATFESGVLGSGFSVQYPEGWSDEVGEGDIRLSNNADIMNLEDAPENLPAGTIAMSVSLTPASAAQGLDVTALVQTFVDFAQASSSAPEYGDIETIMLDGRKGAKAMGTIAGSDNMLLAVDVDGNIVLAIIITPEGELEGHIDTINAIIASVELSPAE